MRFCFDIDGTICTQDCEKYENAVPIQPIIDIINKLHNAGHTIIICTARGTFTGIDWEQRTKQQLSDWRVEYDELHFGKPAADVYVDDKAMHVDKLKSSVESILGIL